MYVVYCHIPYEQSECVFEGSEEELEEWVKQGSKRLENKIHGMYLDDLEIFSTDVPDLSAISLKFRKECSE